VPASIDAVPFDRWRELGAEGVVIGAVRKTATGVTVQVKQTRSIDGQFQIETRTRA
jgi:hypothetical protein